MLFIDVGNTAIKTGQKPKKRWDIKSYKQVGEVLLRIEQDQSEEVIIAGVQKEKTQELADKLLDRPHRIISMDDVNPASLDYETPETLGIDRYLGCLGAWSLNEEAVVVIDAGTACTIDIMDDDGIFRGGVIMPGLKSIMNIFTETAPALPGVKIELPERFPGKTTTESLQWGQVGFFADGIISVLQGYESKFRDFEVYLTGGDAAIVNDLIGGAGEVKQELVFSGMAKMIRNK